jgi:hypothetical protein
MNGTSDTGVFDALGNALDFSQDEEVTNTNSETAMQSNTGLHDILSAITALGTAGIAATNAPNQGKIEKARTTQQANVLKLAIYGVVAVIAIVILVAIFRR